MPKKLNITAATVVKATAGTVWAITASVPGSGVGTVNDAASTGAASATNAIAPVPTTGAAIIFQRGWDCANGIVVVPGTGQTISIDYD